MTLHLTEASLGDFVDGMLDPASYREAESHLAVCAECGRAVQELRELRSWTSAHRAAVRAPAELWPLVAASTIHVRRVRRQVLRSMRALLLVAGLVLVAATAAVTWRIARWAMIPEPAGSGAGTAGHAGHAGHPTTRRPQDGPPAPPRPPRPPGPEAPRGPM